MLTQHMLYFWKAEGSRMSNMTFPCVNTIQLGRSPFNSSPQCKKSSLRHHFRRNSWKLGSQKLLAKANFWFASKFNFSPLWPTSNNQKKTKKGPIWAKNGKKRTAGNFGTTHIDPKSKNNCTLFLQFFKKFHHFRDMAV